MTTPPAQRIRRHARKHRLVVLGWAAFLFVVFFPTLFMGRILSPNDVYDHYSPWSAVERGRAQNPLIHDPPTSYYSVWSMVKDDWDAFDWNRYIASGVPGFGSVAAAVFSPLILIPTLLLPLVLVYSGIVALKFTAALWFTYQWLREERLGKRRAALGALIGGGAGTYAVWWLWQATNATVLYPALLWAIARIFHGKRNRPWLLVLLGVSFIVAGYPAAVAYGAWIGIAYATYLAVRERRLPWRELGRSLGAAALAVLIAAPMLSPFVWFLGRTDYLARRSEMSLQRYPASYLMQFVEPYGHGDPTAKNWTYDPSRGFADNFVENTVYVGLVTLLLALAGLADRRARNRWFWAAALTVLLAAMYGGVLSGVLARLPGIKYSPLFRLRVLLPLCFAYLGACGLGVAFRALRRIRSGSRAIPTVALALVLWTAWDLGGFAGHFYGYLDLDRASVPVTDVARFLRAQPQPFRVAPSFSEFMPNTAQLERIEDIRAHWALEADYRAMLRRIDPSTDERANMTLFNSLNTDFSDPLLALLDVKYVVEPPEIDIVRWRIYEKTTPSVKGNGHVILEPGETKVQQVDIDFDPAWSVVFGFGLRDTEGPRPHVEIRVIEPETGDVVMRLRRSARDLEVEPRIYVPVAGIARTGNALIVEIESVGVRASMEAAGPEDDRQLVYGRVSSPFIYAATFPGGRLWENVGRCRRYRATWQVDSRPFAEVMRDKSFDYRTTTESPALDESWRSRLAAVLPRDRRVSIRPVSYSGSHQVIETSSKVPFLFTTSEKIAPGLRVTVDGVDVEPVRVNGLFLALPLEPGNHAIVIDRRLGRIWRPWSAAGLAAVLAWVWIDRRRAL